jgi:hypothetical protein
MARVDQVPIPLGLVETQAATHRARFGSWPPGYEAWSMRFCRGVVPQRVLDLVERLRRETPWRWCRCGADLEVGACTDCLVAS